MLLDPPGVRGRVLFDWLSNQTNPCALGYFAEILSSFGNDFQDKVHSRTSSATSLPKHGEGYTTSVFELMHAHGSLYGALQLCDLFGVGFT